MARTKYERGYFGPGLPETKLEIGKYDFIALPKLEIDMLKVNQTLQRLVCEMFRVPPFESRAEPKRDGGVR